MAKEELNVIIKAYNKTGTAFKGVNRGLSNLRRSALNLKFALASVSGALAVKTLVKASVDMQKMTLGLKGATGGAESGAKEFAYLNEVVDKLKLDLKSSGEAFTLLTAAARGTSLEGQQTREAFEAIAISSKVLGRSAADTEGVLYALQQMISKGKVTSEELRRQMGDRLPGAFKMAAKAMNMTEAELDSAMRKGEVYSTDFIPKFTKVLMGAYADQLPAALQTTASKMAELSTAMFRMKATFAESGVIDVIKTAADAFIDFAKSRSVSEAINDIGSSIKNNKEEIKIFFNDIMVLFEGLATASAGAITAVSKVVGFTSNKAKAEGLYAGGAISSPDAYLAKRWDAATDSERELMMLRTQRLKSLKEIQRLSNRFRQTFDSNAEAELKAEEEKNKKIEARITKILKLIKLEKEEADFFVADSTSLKRAGELSVEQQRAADWNRKQRESATLAGDIKSLSNAGAISKEQQRSAAWEAEQVARKKKEAEEAAAEREKETAKLREYAKAGEGVTDMWLAQADGMKEANARMNEMNVSTSEWLLGAKAGLEQYADYIGDVHDGMEQTVTKAFSSMEDAIVEFTKTGKLNFSDLADSIISDMMRMVVQQNITTPLAGMVNTWLSGVGGSSMTVSGSGGIANTWSPIGRSANGNAFGPNGLIKAFASGGVVNSPTLFTDAAGGANVMGESGAEGILPLKRVGGKLGVNAEGMGGVSINQNFDLRNADESSVPKLTAAARQIKQETLAAVRQSLSRGGDLYTLTRG